MARALQLRDRSNTTQPTQLLAALDQGGTDPGKIAAFLVFDIPFEVEPATGMIFPAEVDRG